MAVKLGDLLVKSKLISNEQLQEGLKEVQSSGMKLGESLVKLGYITEDDITETLSAQFGVPSINLSHFEIDPAVLKLVAADVARKYNILPVNKTGATITIAMADPTNVFAMDDIKFMTGYNVEPVVASEAALQLAIDKHYGATHALELKKVMEEMSVTDTADTSLEVVEESEQQTIDLEKLVDEGEEAPVIRLVNIILTDAIKRGASDIHIKPYEREYRVRYRIDGILYEVMNPPPKLKEAIASRIKILAKLDIAEKRLPQDGRIKIRMKLTGKVKELDYRVSVLPTLFGEKIVCRLLDKDNLMLDMTKLGFEKESLLKFEKAILRPWGMVLVTGPTVGEDEHALLGSLAHQHARDEHHDGRGSRRVQPAGGQPGPDEGPDRPELRGRPALVPPAGSEHHPRRRDPRLRDGGNRGQGVPHRAPRALDAPHERRAFHDQPSHEHGHRALPRRDVGHPHRGAAPDPARLRELQGPHGSRPAGPRPPRLHGGGRQERPGHEGQGLREVQQHRLQRPRRARRGARNFRGDPRAHPLWRVFHRDQEKGPRGGYGLPPPLRAPEDQGRHDVDRGSRPGDGALATRRRIPLRLTSPDA